MELDQKLELVLELELELVDYWQAVKAYELL